MRITPIRFKAKKKVYNTFGLNTILTVTRILSLLNLNDGVGQSHVLQSCSNINH